MEKTETLKLVNRSVSHDMIGPLNSIVQLAKLLFKSNLTEPQL